jgi:hypothetical protein
MKRREFIALIGKLAAAWPVAARAQQPAKLPTIGLLGASTPSDWSRWVAAFVQRLGELGWNEGRSIAIEYRWAEGRSERYSQIAAEFVRRKVDVIVTVGSAVAAAKQATSVIPIVFAVANDPRRQPVAARRQRHWTVGSVARACRKTGRTLARGHPRSSPIGDHGECRLSSCRAGNEWDGGSGPHPQPRCHQVGNPASRGYLARHCSAQRECRRALSLRRLAHKCQPRSHQRLCTSDTIADVALYSGSRRARRFDVLWTELFRLVSTRCRPRRQDSALSETCRHPG